MFTNFGEKEGKAALLHVMQLRKAGISAELYPETAKMKKQMSYADTKHIPFVAIVGENEINNGTIALKNMATGEQCELTIDELISRLG